VPCFYRAAVCRVPEIKSSSIGDKLRAVNYSILFEITGEYNAIKGHYAKPAGNETSSCVRLNRRELGHNDGCEVCHAAAPRTVTAWK